MKKESVVIKNAIRILKKVLKKSNFTIRNTQKINKC